MSRADHDGPPAALPEPVDLYSASTVGHWPNPPVLPSVSDLSVPSSPPADEAQSPTLPAIDASRLELDLADTRTRIGVGTHGSVHVARYFGELVAVKRVAIPPVSAKLAADPFVQKRRADALRRFAREIRRYERVSHPGIVRFLGVATLPEEDAALLVTELMSGGSLADSLDALRESKVPLQQTSFVRVALQACSGLRALHAASCTWGDAKPGNVLLSDSVDVSGHFPMSAEARISDFGLSRTVGQNLLADTTVSATGQPMGTYNYMAPEVFRGLDVADKPDVAKAADVYAFGMVLYEMLTLRTPWKRRQLMEVFHDVDRGVRPPWPQPSDEDYIEEIPEEMRSLIEKCWAESPQDRPTAEEVFRVLEQYNVSLSKRDESQRPVSDISQGQSTGLTQFTLPNGTLMRVPSKQSIASTAVVLGDTSIELQSSGVNSSCLTSTRESARVAEVSDEEQVMYGSLTGMGSHLNGAPRVSPVTSPEPRSLNTPNGGGNNQQTTHNNDRTGAFYRSAGVDQVEPSTHIITSGNAMKITDDRSNTGILDDVGSHLNGTQRYAQHHVADEDAPRGSQAGRQAESAAEVGSHREESELLAAAGQLADLEASGALAAFFRREGNHMASVDLYAGNTMDSTVYTTVTSPKRRRSKRRVLTIIEQATIALLEARRQSELEGKLPPKQRKEAADRRAVEEAKLSAEKTALEAIEFSHEEGDFSTILDNMKDHRDSAAVAKLGTTYLEHYCQNDSLYFDLCEEGAVEELLSGAVRFGKKDAALCTSFCNSMTILSEYYDDKVGHLIRATGVPTAVIDILEQHSEVVSVQVAGCKCLGAIAGASELSRSAVATLGGPSAVYKAMTKNNASYRDVELAKASLRAVKQIAQDNERAAEFLVQVAALDAVSRSADVFTDDGLEGDILNALRSFAFYNGGRRNIIISSGLKALTEIMLRNKDPDFLVRCCTFIREIARWRDVECEEAMLQSCIAERITTLMQSSNDMRGEEGARVSWYASQACTFLASFGSRSKQRLRDVGAIDTTISILNRRRENYRVVKCATDALAELTKGEPESRLYAERCGALEALNAALELHGNNMRVRNAVQWTIDLLSSTQGANPGPAQGSPVYQEMMGNGSMPDGHHPDRRHRRIFGLRFPRGR